MIRVMSISTPKALGTMAGEMRLCADTYEEIPETGAETAALIQDFDGIIPFGSVIYSIDPLLKFGM